MFSPNLDWVDALSENTESSYSAIGVEGSFSGVHESYIDTAIQYIHELCKHDKNVDRYRVDDDFTYDTEIDSPGVVQGTLYVYVEVSKNYKTAFAFEIERIMADCGAYIITYGTRINQSAR